MRRRCGRHRRQPREDRRGRRRQRAAAVRTVPRVQTRHRGQRGASVPGSHDHGRLPRMRLQLPRHGQLRAEGRGAFRILVAVGLSGPLQGRGTHGDPRLRFRPGRDGHLHGLCRQAPFRRNPLPRHRRLQRRQPRHGFRHELQPRDQHPRGDPERALLRERRVGGDRAARDPQAAQLSGHRRSRVVRHLPRGAGVAREELSHDPACALLDDLRPGVPDAPARDPEHRHGAYRPDHLQRRRDRPDPVPQGGSSRSQVAGRQLSRPDLDRLPHQGPEGRQGAHLLYL